MPETMHQRSWKSMMTHGETERQRAVSWPRTRSEFERFVEAYQHRLVRFAFRTLGRHDEAEDVVQDVFVGIYRRLGDSRDILHVSAYLYRVTSNACTDVLRKRKRQGERLDDVPPERLASTDTSVHDRVAGRDELERIVALFAGLPEEQAEVVRLRLLDRLSFAEIAIVLAIPLGTVKSRFRYGLEKLRSALEAEREDPT